MEHLFDVDMTMEDEWVAMERGFLEYYWSMQTQHSVSTNTARKKRSKKRVLFESGHLSIVKTIFTIRINVGRTFPQKIWSSVDQEKKL